MIVVLLGLAAIGGAGLLAGWAPLGVSIASLFLFAGPHNWMEFRYFLAKMPPRWGERRGFYILAIAGVLGLSAAFVLHLPGVLWNMAFVLWIAWLFNARDPRRPASFFAWAIAFALVGAAWWMPETWDVMLVFAHPIIALTFLERIVRRWRPEWLKAYIACLLAVPVVLGALAWQLAGAPPFPDDDLLTARIAGDVGAGVLSGISPRFLVAAHVFLQLLHYAVWIVAVPALGMRAPFWKLSTIPLFRRWKPVVICVAGGGAVAVVALWGGFLNDYSATRDVYFTAAMVHVLAEFPFLVRTL